LLQLSTDITSKDRFFKNTQMFDPIKPHPPVTITFIVIYVFVIVGL
jgi:hypothetical protein